MKKRQEQPNREFEQTFFALLIAFLGGGAFHFISGQISSISGAQAIRVFGSYPAGR
jgi:hypothetical protein